MSTAIMILGESGTGKTSSLRTLAPQQVTLIQAVRKPLPFKATGWKHYKNPDDAGNIFVTDNCEKICRIITGATTPIVVLDDNQYTMSNEFMRRVTDKESGAGAFQKYNEIAQNQWSILNAASNAQDHKRVYILSHTSTDEAGHTKIKTIGKLLDEKIVPEGLVSIVLRTKVQNGQYLFRTRNDGYDTVKTPMGMFDEELIENDLAKVDQAICDYYSI